MFFAGRGCSAVWGYVDYPLGVHLLGRRFMHVFSGERRDRWLYIAYDLLLFSFGLPFFRHMKGNGIRSWYIFWRHCS